MFDVIMMDTNINILVILRYFLKLDLKGTEAACRIFNIQENKTLSDHFDKN